MRMWMIDPKMLCDQHLLGEHVELHMFVGTINAGKSIDGYLKNGLLEPNKIRERHNELKNEMTERGMNHDSLLPKIQEENLPDNNGGPYVDPDISIKHLNERCNDCRQRISEQKK